MKQYETFHLIKGEDLNHHGTLFAARAAAWFVEAGFVAAGCVCGTTDGIVCRNLHQMSFQRPVKIGTILRFLARVVYTGKSSFMVAVTAVDTLQEAVCIEGMITFVSTDGRGNKTEHHICLDACAEEEEVRQRRWAEEIRRQGMGAGL